MLAIYKHVDELIQSALWPSQGWRHWVEVAGHDVTYLHGSLDELMKWVIKQFRM